MHLGDLCDPPGHGQISGHYFHTWRPYVRKTKTHDNATSWTMLENNNNLFIGRGLVGHLKFARLLYFYCFHLGYFELKRSTAVSGRISFWVLPKKHLFNNIDDYDYNHHHKGTNFSLNCFHWQKSCNACQIFLFYFSLIKTLQCFC